MTDNNNQPNTPPAGDTGTQPGGVTTPNQAATPDVRTFTQADLDRIVADRLSQQKRSLETQYADYNALKERSDKLKTIEDSQKTELQRIQDDTNTKLTDLQNKLTTLTTERDTSLVLARAATTKAAVLSEASAQGVVGKQLDAMYKLVDQSKLTFDDSGEVTNAADVVKATLEQYDFLKSPVPQQTPPPAKPGVKINPTNPSGTSNEPDLSWHRINRTAGNSFQGGGVRAPNGDKK